MTSLLYYSVSSNLTEHEMIEMDKQVARNQEKVYLFLTKLPSNSKRKAKKICFQMVFMFMISQPLAPCAAVMLPLPPAIHRLSPIEESRIRTNKNYPQIAAIPASKVDKIKLTNEQIKQFDSLALQLSSGSITMEEGILQLRGGAVLTDIVAVIAFVIFVNWYDSLFGVEAFRANPLPHQDPFGWLNGKYDRKPMQHTSYKSSRFELEMAGVNDNMCPGLAMADENGFVMSYEYAYNLVAETYPGYLEVNESCKITDWQAAKHIYHANGMGIDPADYGFTQQELERIRGEAGYKGEGGLIGYARRGYRLPPIEMVRDYQFRLKGRCDQSPIKRTNVPYYDNNGAWKATVFATPPSEDSSGIIIAFNESTGDLITGDKQKKPAFDRFKDENYLGGKKWMLKWSNK
jgi:hypothetical protein